MHSIMNDSVLGRLKCVAKNEDSQVYGKTIPDVMVNDAIKNSTAYQTYRAFSTGATIPKKAKKGTKGQIKSEAKEQEEARRVHETHERLVTGVIIRDIPSVSKKQNLESSMKLKGIELLSDAAQLEIDTQKAVQVPDEPKDKSADSSEGVSTSPEVLRIPTTVPATTPTIDPPVIHDDTSLIPTETPTISLITSIIPPTAFTTHYTSPFIHIDSSDDDTPDTPPLPTHEIPPVEVSLPTNQIIPAPFVVCGGRVTIVSPGQPIPYGRPYRYHPNGPVHMMITRKRVGPLPIHRLAIRHSIDYSSSDHFTSDDSARDSPSETSSDSSLDALSDSSYVHSSSDHSSPALSSETISFFFCGSRSPTTSIPVSSPVPRALSSVCADLLPPRKRIRSFNSAMDLEDCSDGSSESSVPRETSLRDDIDVRGSDEPYSEPDIDHGIQAKIEECIAYADALRAERIDDRVMVKIVA
ncbi:hypothetical protein Tco_0509129 [Tanacetum coccineum]